jgi:hypothetical protein
MDIGKFLDFKIPAIYARTSILSFVEILRSGGDGLVDSGAECTDLGIQEREDPQRQQQQPEQETHSDSTATVRAVFNPMEKEITEHQPSASSGHLQDSCSHNDETTQENIFLDQQFPAGLSNLAGPNLRQQSFGLYHPFSGAALLDLFPNDELPDPEHYPTIPVNLFDLNLEGWDMPELGT